MLSDIPRFIATSETMKHRVFVFLDKSILPDNMLVNIALSNTYSLGVLSSKVHCLWALTIGSNLGPTPRYNKTRCFETFPFPDASEAQQATIRELAERLDAHRKRQQEQHPELTLTGMYNVLEKLRAEEPLTAKEKTIHEQGLVSVLRELHDDLDRAVFDAYGWNDLAEQLVGLPGATTPLPDKPEAQSEAEEELLKRLVELNSQRAAEEAQGKIRWLRPEYQDPNYGQHSEQITASQTELDTDSDSAETATTATGKTAWPKTMREQISAVRTALQTGPQTTAQLASQFRGKRQDAVQSVLDALQELGIVTQKDDSNYSLAGGN